MDKRTCEVPGCARPYAARGLCNTHYKQRRRRGVLASVQEQRDTRKRDEAGRKQCCACEEWLPEESFSRDTRARDGLNGRCTRCIRSGQLMKLYGISIDDYEKLLQAQGGVCAICGGGATDGKELSVDHDHTCCPGKKSCGRCIRALLCSMCNLGLGNFLDSPHLLKAAIAYLTR